MVLRLILALLLALSLSTQALAATWTVVEERDIDHVPDWDCGTDMSENDFYWIIQDGSLAPGESITMTHPRPACWVFHGRLVWRWYGGQTGSNPGGRPPEGIVLTITAPDGTTFSGGPTEVYNPVPGIPPGQGDLVDIVTSKQGKPTWVRMCHERNTAAYLGTWTFSVTNTGTRTADNLRVGAYLRLHEFDYHGCVTETVFPPYWWPNELSARGL